MSGLMRRIVGAIAVITCVAAAGRAPTAPPSLAFGGRLFAPDGGSLDGIRVVATDEQGSYEAVVDSTGVFVGAFATPPRGRVTVRVFTDSAPRYHPSVVTIRPGASAEPARIVLVPTRWRVRDGAFGGRDVAIDPVRATTHFGTTAGFWRLTRHGRLAGRAVAWSDDSLPLRVAFRRERHDPRISAGDSIGFWALVADLEQTLGLPLFRPATFEEIDGGADGILVTIDRRMSSAGRTFITYDESGRIYEALVSVSHRELLADPRVGMHELLHAIGFGHTSAWGSLMSTSARSVARPTAEDVAYAQLLYAISSIQRERDAPYGIAEAMRNVRF